MGCSPKSLRRSLIGLGMLMSLAGCGNPTTSGAETSILLTVTSAVPVQEVELRARNIDYVSDAVVFDVGGRDLSASGEPIEVLLLPSDIASEAKDARTGGFLVHALGRNSGATVATVAGAKRLFFVAGQRVEERIDMAGGFNDGDGDGFATCAAPGPSCDCDDSDPQINPFTREQCGDGIDNNCSGFPPDEDCGCSQDERCTTLTADQWHLAGVGVCVFGVNRCVNGVLEATCTGAGQPGPGDDGGTADGLDNDCDGTVDEGSGCAPAGITRSCFRGLIGAAADAAVVGACTPGVQTCLADQTWGNCEGEIFPPPHPDQPGYAPEGPDQCDGLDNDCDGEVDEEPSFDSDRDGFTYCGTCSADATAPNACASCRADPRHDALLLETWGLRCEEHIDCDDGNAAISPVASERCDTQEDDDCRCDHADAADAATIIGFPTFHLDGTPRCPADRSSLHCDTPGLVRNDSQVPVVGFCDDGSAPGPYFHGYFDGSCYLCGAQYGLSCDLGTGTCSTKENDCATCAASTPPSPTLLATERPLCFAPANNSCTGLDGAAWEVTAGSDPYGDCGSLSCAGIYFPYAPGDVACYERRDLTADEVVCVGGADCNAATASAATCCGQAAELCPLYADAPAATRAAPTEPCLEVVGGCNDLEPPQLAAQARGNDWFNECSETFSCNIASGGGPFYWGVRGDPPRCYYKDDVSDNACNGATYDPSAGLAPDCMNNAEACDAVTTGSRAVSRALTGAACTIVTSGCQGAEPPVYGDAVVRGDDPYNECIGSCCDRACCQLEGGACVTDVDCEPGLACTDDATGSWVCCDRACNGVCEACVERLTGLPDGTCGFILAEMARDATPICSGPTGGCGSADCLCDGAGGCKNAQGQPCTGPGDCAGGLCVDGFCCDRACDGLCESCSGAVNGGINGTCGTVAVSGTPDPPTCAASNGCVGSAPGADCACRGGVQQCLGVNGSVCNNSGDCLSGNCVSGICCNSPCTGNCATCATGTCSANEPACPGSCNTCKPNGSGFGCLLELAGAEGFPSCYPYVCSGGSNCYSDCQRDDNGKCAPGVTCDLIIGAPDVCRVTNGYPCWSNGMCWSGNCSGGVCR